MVKYVDRETGELKTEDVAGGTFLRWLYETRSGSGILELLVKRKIFSFIYGKLQDTPFSKRKINNFIRTYNINPTDFKVEVDKFKTFNDFFTRHLKEECRGINPSPNVVISPCDGKVSAYQMINRTRIVQIKGIDYDLNDLLNNEALAEKYSDGSCVVIRLSPTDYHRFHFPDGGIPTDVTKISGSYYSVNPIALRKKVEIYCRNKREFTTLNSDNFGDILMLEVGATCVGSIMQTFTPFERVERGQEKGYFKFGGSTVMLLFQKGQISLDEDLLRNTQEDKETSVKLGMKIGIKVL